MNFIEKGLLDKCPIKPQAIVVSTAKAPDVHGGDIETGYEMSAFRPESFGEFTYDSLMTLTLALLLGSELNLTDSSGRVTLADVAKIL